MSERRIGDAFTKARVPEDSAISYAACKGAPVTIKEGAVVAMAEALEWCESVLSDRYDYPESIRKARHALAMYNGEEG